MRKRNITAVADTIYWYIIYLLPFILLFSLLIAYIVSCSGLAQAGGSWVINGELLENQDRVQEGFLNGFYEWTIDGWGDAFADGWTRVSDIMVLFTDDWMESQFITPVGQALLTLNEFYLTDGFGADFLTSYAICSLTWFINANIIHLAVDFLLFIPRLAHKWLKKGTQDD